MIVPTSAVMESGLIWLTNASEDQLDRPGFRNIIIGDPLPTEHMDLSELKRQGVVGVYRRAGEKDFRTNFFR